MPLNTLKTYYVVVPFLKSDDGSPVPDEPREVKDAGAAERLAARLAQTRYGVVAFSRTGDPTFGEFDDAVVIARHGRVALELLGP